ncbi:MAG: hypothetical protein MMC23_001108 [Stictis urceolatum]|nr:hypothetical protein [Stictis urceolata]
MEARFFVEDTVGLKKDLSIIAYVEQTWRDVDSGSYPEPEDWISHAGVDKGSVKKCFSEGRPPKNHVIIRFLHPIFACTLIKESALVLIDRGLAVGDVVKRNASDVESGYVVKTSMECTIQPVYTDLPWSNSYNWPYKEKECRMKVPSEELTFFDYQEGDYVMYHGWFGEVADIREEVTVRLGNGSIVRVNDSDKLEVAALGGYDDHKRDLVKFLQEERKKFCEPSAGEVTGSASFFHPGQIVYTVKSNLRLGRWIIGSYSPAIRPRGVVVECRVVEMTVNWLTPDIYVHPYQRHYMPPQTLTTDEIDEVRLYNRNNVSSNSNLASDNYGSRQGHDIGAGDYVKFRDVTAAAVKYSKASPQANETGVFHRVPRHMTEGFDMNSFSIIGTTQTASIQWQSGSVTELPSTECIPYLNVDEHDLWIGELCSLKSAEVKEEGEEEGLIRLEKVGVVQSVDARERTVAVRWYESPDVAVFKDQLGILSSGSTLGDLSDVTEIVSMYEVIAYPALTKRRGDLVVIAPREGVDQWNPWEMDDITMDPEMVPRVSERMGPIDMRPDTGCRWFGEVVDMGTDGLLTLRLGGLEQVEDIKVPVTRVQLVIGGDDGDHGSDDDDDDGDDDYYDDLRMNMDSFFGGYDVSDDEDSLDLDSDDEVSFDLDDINALDDALDADDSEEVVLEEVITYEGGARMDDGGDDDDWEDEDQDDADEEMKDDCGEDQEMKDGHPDPHPPIAIGADTVDDPTSSKPYNNLKSETHSEYDFRSLANMPDQFEILSDPPAPDHRFIRDKCTLNAAVMRRIRKEHSIMSSSLPTGIWVRTWEERLDLLRILIVGPRGTPYELAPFVLDMHFKSDFPTSPPKVHFHSWTYGVGRINPNLYEDGKVCLSVLGTWPEGGSGEGWNKDKSSVLQILVSLMGLVLVEKPYYNEAGFESLVGAEETVLPSQIYTEKAYCMAKGFLAHALSHTIVGLTSVLGWLYLDKAGPQLLKSIVEESKAKIAQGKNGSNDEGRLSAGAEVLLKKHLGFLERLLEKLRK